MASCWQVDVGPLDFHLARLPYMTHQVFTFDIKNTGDTLANWRFVPKLDRAELSEQWCLATPSLGMLSPKEVSDWPSD
jgi:hypothetical protein